MVRVRHPVGGRAREEYNKKKKLEEEQRKAAAEAARTGNNKDAKRNSGSKSHSSKDGKQSSSHGHSSSSSSNNPVSDVLTTSRKEVDMLTINTNGKKGLGQTTSYKTKLIRQALEHLPEVVFIQDSIEYDDLTSILGKCSDGKYDYFFQELTEDDDSDRDRNSSVSKRSFTGIAWNKSVYRGTPLQLDDDRLGEYREWLVEHDMTVVKMDSRERVGLEDVHPSFIGISWHGPDYNLPLRERVKVCEEFFEFLTTLRQNNWNMSLVIGGDFNLDMKSFSMKAFPGFVLVPYRPVSGALAKDLKNTFVFTMDTLQVTETGFKQHHPEFFPNPFISVRVRGRNQLKIWAVVRIQRAVRRWLGNKERKARTKKMMAENKARWQKKLGVSEEKERSTSERDGYSSDNTEVEKRRGGKNGKNGKSREPRKDRKYCLYWDEKDDPNYQGGNKELTEDEYSHRKRKDFTSEGKKNVMDDFYNRPMNVDMGSHRRKKYNDIKSIQERRQEAEGSGYRDFADDDYRAPSPPPRPKNMPKAEAFQF